MGTFTLIIALLLSPLFAAFPPEISGSILYRMHQGDAEKALKLYLDHVKETGEDDFELLGQTCIQLLESGMKSHDSETQLMCMFGAGIANNTALIPILQKGLMSEEPKAQIVSLHYLADLDDDEGNLLLQEALSSPFLLTRLEAAFELAQKKDKTIIDALHSLFYKVPGEVRILFAPIIAEISSPLATKFLEKLMSDGCREVRLSAALEAGSAKRDDLIPRLRCMAMQTDPGEQEAALHSLSLLQDMESKPLLMNHALKKKDHLKLVALQGLYHFGEDVFPEILSLAEEKNLFAISLLRECRDEEKCEEVLLKLARDEDFTLSLNASLALLQQGKSPPLSILKTMLVRTEKDLGFQQQYSPGHALSYWKEIPSSHSLEKMYPGLLSETSKFRQKILRAALELPEETFLSCARLIFDCHQYDLVPPLIELLENSRTEKAIALLKEMQQKAGAPLIRNYCSLALYRMNIEGPYEETLLRFCHDTKNHPIIQFKEEKKKHDPSRYELSPEETSQFLISVFEALATKQNQRGRDALIHACAYGHPKNKYALAGLLMRMIE